MTADEIVSVLKGLREQKAKALATLKATKASINEKTSQLRSLRYELKQLKTQYAASAAEKKRVNAAIAEEQVKFAKVL